MKSSALALAATALVSFGPTSAVAQTPTQGPRTRSFEVSGGYQFLYVADAPGTTFPFGLAVDIAAGAGSFGFVAEGGWSIRSEGDEPDDIRFTFWHAGAGVRWTSRKHPRIWPYAQTLLGASFHSTSGEIAGLDQADTSAHFMVQPGGGVNYVVSKRVGIFGAVDYRRVVLEEDTEGDSGLNEIRLFVGVRLSLR